VRMIKSGRYSIRTSPMEQSWCLSARQSAPVSDPVRRHSLIDLLRTRSIVRSASRS
jgi:hypothetical protein